MGVMRLGKRRDGVVAAVDDVDVVVMVVCSKQMMAAIPTSRPIRTVPRVNLFRACC